MLCQWSALTTTADESSTSATTALLTTTTHPRSLSTPLFDERWQMLLKSSAGALGKDAEGDLGGLRATSSRRRHSAVVDLKSH